MSLRKKLRAAVAGAGLAAGAVLAPVSSKLEEPQAQSIPDRDYEGVKRAPGGGFQPADEVREDVWVVQSRSSAEATALFYGGDAKRGGDVAAVDLGTSPQVDLAQKLRLTDLGADGVRAQNDAEWERRKRNLALAGRLESQRPRTSQERLREGLFEGEAPVRAGHTCHTDPLAACEGCLEQNR